MGVTFDRDPDAVAAALGVALHADERRHADALAPLRRPSWTAGRLALRAALARAGVAATVPILPDDRGAPIVPPGAVGSISHKRALAVAAAAPDRGWTLGVDVEDLGACTLDIAPRVLTDGELAGIAHLSGDDRSRAVLLRFSIKEAVYKAIDPFVRRFVGFREVAVTPVPAGPDAGAGSARVAPRLRPGEPALVVEARWLVRDGAVIATARARVAGAAVTGPRAG